MLNPRLRPLPLLLVAALGLGGCPSAPPRQPEPEPVPQPRPGDLRTLGPRTDTDTRPIPITEPVRSPLDDPAGPLYRKVVYFDYDVAEIKPQYTDLLRTHAGYIYQTPGVRVTLEGHTDERGTRAYNLALGERRADAVRRFLVAEGVPVDRLTTLSYGEERPADPGQGEQSWALNRRVELVY
ncbi:MAG: peptidoglycan-associated lipoprotein Pal [Chromatiaceae bacterium]|nr:MAG: peptidoglycan-associated lipoprotein Pal [Chromatiaceae bacterium]